MKRRKVTVPRPAPDLAQVVGGQHVDNPGQTPMKIKDPEQRS